jgi:prevent-host-death family protein
MPAVGVRELKARATEILREVGELGTRYVVTVRGRPVGVLIPFDSPEIAPQTGWDGLWEVGAELATRWNSQCSSVELLDEMRR